MSNQLVMEGKQIVVIGGGTYQMRNLWPDAKGYGIKITIVEPNPNHAAKDNVHCFIEYDFSDHTRDQEHASSIISKLHGLGIKPDGCLAFCNECTPLVALICEKLELRGLSFKAAVTATSKSQTQSVLGMNTKDVSSLHADIFSSRAFHLRSLSDCEMLPEGFKFPAILKMDNCCGAVGTCKVDSRKYLKEQFQQTTNSLQTDSDFPGIGLWRGNSMTTSEFYSGTEHNVEVILYDKQLVWAFVTDSGVARQPTFIITAKRMPTFLAEDKRSEIIDAAYRCCRAIDGLTDGIFNVEFIMTTHGPKLIEINPRMCGYIFRDWLKKLYGIDTMLHAMMISCGIKPERPDFSGNQIYMGVMVIPSIHGKLLTDNIVKNKLRKMIETGDVFFQQFLDNFEHMSTYDKPFGNVAVSGSDTIEAKRKLMNVCKALGIDQNGYPVEQFIKNF